MLFITGYAENAAVGNGHLAPGMAVLTKPFAIETMAARIRSMITALGYRAERAVAALFGSILLKTANVGFPENPRSAALTTLGRRRNVRF